ncbi:MFS-type transporter SLC18B1 isoform X9 [Rhincodon typus]|uniref:MFS-type transporter SLC18B1 isoform X9 n=1 Tax=Rhincodon typus TaxID=259920 RepID=UPI00202DE6DD|nr:MFS-type transporter SLC18B1 isoform X9 [Rhincodon typus]
MSHWEPMRGSYFGELKNLACKIGRVERIDRIDRFHFYGIRSKECVSLGRSQRCVPTKGQCPVKEMKAGRKGANDTVVGMIFGCFALFNLIFSLLLGKYIVQIGAKFMFVSGMFISGCCTILFGLLDKAPDGLVFIVLCFVVRSMDAIGFSGCVTASFSILAATFPNNIATIMGLLEIFAGLGLVMGPPIGGFLYQMFGYEVPFIAVGCIALSMVPLNMGILPNYGGIASSVSFWKLLAIPKVTLVCLIVFSVSSCIGFLDPTIPLFLTQKRIRKWLLLVGSWLIAVSFSFLGPAPIFHIKCENGFEEGLGTLGLVSGIFGAWWCLGSFVGPTLGGYLYEKLGFEWAAVIQGSFPLFFVGLWDSRRRRASTTDTKLNLDILTGLNGLQLSFRQPLDILVFQIVFTNSVFTQLSYINSAICL